MARGPLIRHAGPMRPLAIALLLAACVRFPDPADLPGTYESAGAPAALELAAGTWTLTSGAIVKSGVYQVSGDHIGWLLTDVNHVAFERYCRDEADTYRFWFQDGDLLLRGVGEVCDLVAESVLTAGPWRREGA